MTYDIGDINCEEVVGTFYEKEFQQTNQTEFRIEKVTGEKVINYMSNGKVKIINLIVRLTKRILLYKMCYLPVPYAHSKNEIKVELIRFV